MCPNPHQDASPNNAGGDDLRGIAQVHKRSSLAVDTYTSAFLKRMSLVGAPICRPDSATKKERTLTTLRANAETRLIRCGMLCTVRASRTCIPVHGRQACTCVHDRLFTFLPRGHRAMKATHINCSRIVLDGEVVVLVAWKSTLLKLENVLGRGRGKLGRHILGRVLVLGRVVHLCEHLREGSGRS